MTSQYPIVDRTNNLNPQQMQAVKGLLCGLLGRQLCLLIDYIVTNNENSTIMYTASAANSNRLGIPLRFAR